MLFRSLRSDGRRLQRALRKLEALQEVRGADQAGRERAGGGEDQSSPRGSPACRGTFGGNCQSLPQAELFVRQRERPGLPSQAVAWPPRCKNQGSEGSSICLEPHSLEVLARTSVVNHRTQLPGGRGCLFSFVPTVSPFSCLSFLGVHESTRSEEPHV